MNFAPPDEIAVSQFGFGCSGLMSRLNRKQSRHLLETAFANGITHFDVARGYGHGEAESVVGDFIANRRSAVTITTKVGNLPPPRTCLVGRGRAVARRHVTLHPRLRRLLRRVGESMAKPSTFNVQSIRSSIQASLQELRTDYIDVLLLHDCTVEDLANPELLLLLQDLQHTGTIRRFGVGTGYRDAAHAHALHPDFTKVVQFANNPWEPNANQAGWAAGLTMLTHSAVGPAFRKILPALTANAELAARWSNRLGYDALNSARLGEDFLGAALGANPNGSVLFSSQNPATIAAIARITPRPDLWSVLCALTASCRTDDWGRLAA